MVLTLARRSFPVAHECSRNFLGSSSIDSESTNQKLDKVKVHYSLTTVKRSFLKYIYDATVMDLCSLSTCW